MKKEIWKPVFGGIYAVSDRGRVKRLLWHRAITSTGVLKPTVTHRGYELVTLSIGGKLIYRLVHRLVAEAFLGKCPRGKQVNHQDGDKRNNRPKNLQYVTATQNVQHSVRTGLQFVKLSVTDVLFIREHYRRGTPWHPGNALQLATRFSISRHTVYAIVGRRKRAHLR